MKVYKLKYDNREIAIENLINDGVYDNNLSYGTGIQAVVEIGKIIEIYPTFDADGNQITDPVFIDGYYFDVMGEDGININENEVFPVDPKHIFLQ
jgi:hypothetical protein